MNIEVDPKLHRGKEFNQYERLVCEAINKARDECEAERAKEIEGLSGALMKSVMSGKFGKSS